MFALRDQKARTEQGLGQILRHGAPFAQADLTRAHELISSLLDTAELVSQRLVLRLPDSLSELRIASDDLAAILTLSAGFWKEFADHAAAATARFPSPTGREYSNLLCAVGVSVEPAMCLETKRQLEFAGFPIWDDAEVEGIRAAAEHNTTFIPERTPLNDPIFEKLLNHFIERLQPTALVLGGGGAIAVTSHGPEGMPNWEGLTSLLVAEASKIGNWSPEKTKERGSSKNGIRVAYHCKTALSSYWEQTLEDIFAWPRVDGKQRDTSLYRNLHILPFRCRLTTNYDSLYERINNVNGLSRANLRKAVGKWNSGKWATSIAHLHGAIDVGDDLILAEDDYNEFYGDEANARIIRDVFTSSNVILVGMGMTDPFFTFVLAKLKLERESAHDNERHYYAFTDSDNEEELDLITKQYGIEFIRYPKDQHQFQAYYIQRLTDEYHKAQNETPLRT